MDDDEIIASVREWMDESFPAEVWVNNVRAEIAPVQPRHSLQNVNRNAWNRIRELDPFNALPRRQAVIQRLVAQSSQVFPDDLKRRQDWTCQRLSDIVAILQNNSGAIADIKHSPEEIGTALHKMQAGAEMMTAALESISDERIFSNLKIYGSSFGLEHVVTIASKNSLGSDPPVKRSVLGVAPIPVPDLINQICRAVEVAIKNRQQSAPAKAYWDGRRAQRKFMATQLGPYLETYIGDRCFGQIATIINSVFHSQGLRNATKSTVSSYFHPKPPKPVPKVQPQRNATRG